MTDDFDELERIADSVHGDYSPTHRGQVARRNFKKVLNNQRKRDEKRWREQQGYCGARANPPITLPKIAAKCPAP